MTVRENEKLKPTAQEEIVEWIKYTVPDKEEPAYFGEF
jgi:hypothetical protein